MRKYFENAQVWPDNDGVHINAHGAGILYHDGKYYMFGEFKVEGTRGNAAWVGVSCYSSSDLYNWQNEGIALPVVTDNIEHDITEGSVIERPKVIYNKKTGKFVMWFHLELLGQGYSASRSGVAVADNVTGPYQYLGSFRPDNCMARDMTLFVDDDGSAYHFYSSEDNRTMHIGRLSDDYLTPSGEYVRVFEDRLMEAPAVCKYSGKYWFIASGCTGWAPNAARSAAADNIMGPWVELGNPCIGTPEQQENSFESQSTYILPVAGKDGAYILIADRWKPENAIDGRYIWLPMKFNNGKIQIEWLDEWDLSYFK
jgi:beta-xylosidase